MKVNTPSAFAVPTLAFLFGMGLVSASLDGPLEIPVEVGPLSLPEERPGRLAVALGMDFDGRGALAENGINLSFAPLWITAWHLDGDWSIVERKVRQFEDANVTPVIQFWYWGNVISANCLAQGCTDPQGGHWKSHENWERLADQMTAQLASMGLRNPPVIIVETEFNKGNLLGHEPLDEALARMVERIRAGLPGAMVGVGFGNWWPEGWPTWDRAVAAGNVLGLQALMGGRHPPAEYVDAWRTLVEGAQKLTTLFDLPIVVGDLGLSSYPEPEYVGHQEAALRGILGHDRELADAGVWLIVYRSYLDNPSMDTRDYFGDGEKSWGLVWTNGTWKPAMHVWIEAAKR